MKKLLLLVCCLLCLGTSLWAKKGATMYVNVEEAELKSGTGFFASRTGLLPYGSKVTVLAEDGGYGNQTAAPVLRQIAAAIMGL